MLGTDARKFVQIVQRVGYNALRFCALLKLRVAPVFRVKEGHNVRVVVEIPPWAVVQILVAWHPIGVVVRRAVAFDLQDALLGRIFLILIHLTFPPGEVAPTIAPTIVPTIAPTIAVEPRGHVFAWIVGSITNRFIFEYPVLGGARLSSTQHVTRPHFLDRAARCIFRVLLHQAHHEFYFTVHHRIHQDVAKPALRGNVASHARRVWLGVVSRFVCALL